MIIDIFFSGRIYLVLKKDFITVFESLQLLLATTAMCIDAMMRVDAQSQVGLPCSIELFLLNYRLDSQKLQFWSGRFLLLILQNQPFFWPF